MSSAFRRAKKTPKTSGGTAAGGTATSSQTSSTTSSSVSPLGLLAGGARGVKPWAGGIHLTSSGVSDLDAILGGGQPLGTCILLEEDRWTRDLALSLVKYWCAEAISQEQQLLIPVFDEADEEPEIETPLDGSSAFDDTRADVEELLLSLPRNLHWDKQRKKKEAAEEASKVDETAGATAALASLDILEEGDEDDDEESKEEGLDNAWQYRKAVQQERLGMAQQAKSLSAANNVFCHSYDLSRRMINQSQINVADYIVSLQRSENSCQATNVNAGYSMFRELVALLKKSGGKVVRMLLFHPELNTMAVALPLLLSYIRNNATPVVIMMCTKPTSDYQSLIQLSRSSDVVLSTEGFASRKEYPPTAEFRHLQGLLKISKVSTVTAPTANGGGHFADLTVSKRPAAFIYGFKRDRRKLHIQLLHIPPEEYAEGGGSTSGVRSGAGKPAPSKKPSSSTMGCASNLSGSVLDF